MNERQGELLETFALANRKIGIVGGFFSRRRRSLPSEMCDQTNDERDKDDDKDDKTYPEAFKPALSIIGVATVYADHEKDVEKV